MQLGPRWWLLAGGLLTGAASVLHLAIILGGPPWYRFFGAGEGMARLAARGAAAPTIITAGIAVVLSVWMLYALSGAGLVHVRLPFVRPVLGLIAAVFLTRGLLGIPVVLVAAQQHPYARELRGRMTFMVVSSVICLGLGLCYAVGAGSLRQR